MDQPEYIIREHLTEEEVNNLYVGCPHLFTLKVHHGGKFVRLPGRSYIEGETDFVDLVDIDKFSVHELDLIMRKLDYDEEVIRYYHYQIPGLDLDVGLRPLQCDKDILDLGQYVAQHKMINVYIEHECPWAVLVSRKKNSTTWVLKTLVDEHTCHPTRKVKSCTATFLSKKILDLIRDNPTIPTKSLQEQMKRLHEVDISMMKAFRAKTIALKHINGDYYLQYGRLRDYVEELMKSNPGTTVKIDVEPSTDPTSNSRKFRRIYVCLGSLKRGFKAIGRDLLGLDGAFMKGPYPGQVLSAVGVNPNNNIYPLSYAIVEAGTLNSWTWFLNCLGEDLDLEANSNFTFISDMQKGIIPALEKVFPCAGHRFCLRHISENMKLKYRGKAFKDALWKIATSTTTAYYDRAMEELKAYNNDAYEWLAKIPPKHWSRAHFSGNELSKSSR